jgi:hypothetical protein
MNRTLIDSSKVIELIQEAIKQWEGNVLEEIFNKICDAQVKYIGDDVFELVCYPCNPDKF